jgi:hypothetical protein
MLRKQQSDFDETFRYDACPCFLNSMFYATAFSLGWTKFRGCDFTTGGEKQAQSFHAFPFIQEMELKLFSMPPGVPGRLRGSSVF